MKNRYFLKRIAAAAAAVVLTAGIKSGGIYYPAGAEGDEIQTQAPAYTEIPDSTQGYTDDTSSYPESTTSVYTPDNSWADDPSMDGGEQGDYSRIDDTGSSASQTDSSTADSTQGDDSGDSTAQLNEYAQRLRELAAEQEELDKQLKEAGKDLKAQTEKTNALKKKIESVNKEINVLNGYMTALEIKINTNKRNIEQKKQEIDKGVSEFKQRLRAMYIAGSDSYVSMVLESNSFYDALMRMELVKRVADHDNKAIDNLLKLKEQYEAAQKELDAQQAEYEKQEKALNKKKKNLEELYNTNEDTRKQLERRKKALEKQNKEFMSQRSDLSGILKSTTGNTPQDEQVKATMKLADAKIKELQDSLNERIKSGEKISKDECRYTFAWPVPQSYNITYGIGARWGAYHAGLDIGGDHGYTIKASESGTVLRVNTVCPHDYGKNGSCGCGGGYGKFIIIDHGNDFITLYGHLSEVDVSPGDKIKEGDVIGKMGSTGFSTGDHLHFEIRYQGYILNPAFYVDIK